MADIKIGDDVFTIPLLPALKTFYLQPRLFPVVAEVLTILPQLVDMVGKAGGADKLLEQDVAILLPTVVPVLTRIAQALPPAELEALTRELLGGALMNGKLLFGDDGDPINVKMQGRVLDVWKLLWHAVKENFPDFFRAFTGASGSAVKAPSSSAA